MRLTIAVGGHCIQERCGAMAVNAGGDAAAYSLARGKAAAVTRERVERQRCAALSDARGKVTAVTRAGRERELQNRC